MSICRRSADRRCLRVTLLKIPRLSDLGVNQNLLDATATCLPPPPLDQIAQSRAFHTRTLNFQVRVIRSDRLPHFNPALSGLAVPARNSDLDLRATQRGELGDVQPLALKKRLEQFLGLVRFAVARQIHDFVGDPEEVVGKPLAYLR